MQNKRFIEFILFDIEQTAAQPVANLMPGG
jgi:hypothetical protein